MSDAFYNALCDHQHLEGYEEGYKDGYEAGKRDSAPRWHMVEEELPKVGEYVLAWEWGKFAVVDKWCGDKWGFADDGATYTHWQRIEPPKEGTHENRDHP